MLTHKFFMPILFLVLAGNNSFAQETFKISSSSETYEILVEMDRCNAESKSLNICVGPGSISIYRQGAGSPFQVLKLRNISVNKDQLAYNPKSVETTRKLYDDEYSFIFGDFNFDAKEDLAVSNGWNGGYGAPSYSVYLYNVRSRKFVENRSLSKLTEGSLGLFFADPNKRQLVAYSKSGCCYHETAGYKIVNNRPVLIERLIEEASGDDTRGYVVTVTTLKLVNGKWVKRVSRKKSKAEAP